PFGYVKVASFNARYDWYRPGATGSMQCHDWNRFEWMAIRTIPMADRPNRVSIDGGWTNGSPSWPVPHCDGCGSRAPCPMDGGTFPRLSSGSPQCNSRASHWLLWNTCGCLAWIWFMTHTMQTRTPTAMEIQMLSSPLAIASGWPWARAFHDWCESKWVV